MADQSVYTNFDPTNDIISNVSKLYSEAMWSNNVGTLTAFHTSSYQPSQDYYKNVYNLDPDSDDTAEIQFAVAYGHIDGKGAEQISIEGNDVTLTPSKSIYLQYKNLLTKNATKFVFNSVAADDIFVVNIARNRVKEQIDPGNWELILDNGAQQMTFIDNITVAQTKQIGDGGEYWNIVSGSINAGVVDAATVYGYVYPEQGLIIFDAAKLSSSILAMPVNRSVDTAGDNHILFYDYIVNGSSFKARNKQFVKSTYYFVRVKNKDYNYTSNPSFVTGSVGNLANESMIEGQTTTYITTIGLYNDQNELMAIAKVSKPLAKTFQTEQNFQIKLDW